MLRPELVLLGGPNSGKTHYAGQLYGRLQHNLGLLRLRKDKGTPSDLTALQEVLRCLGDGHAAGHTSSGTWAEVQLPIEDRQGNTMDLFWPDYGGEQLNAVFKDRIVSEKWCSRLCKANGWLLLIRLSGETTYDNALEQLVERAGTSNVGSNGSTASARADKWDANAYWVELLQILLYVARLGTVARLRHPRLAVLLSCYDELETDALLPSQVLAHHLPLLSSFIDSVWLNDAISVWGLSSLGRLLKQDSNDENFIEEGPETQGWVVAPNGGSQDSDLSRPLAWLLGVE